MDEPEDWQDNFRQLFESDHVDDWDRAFALKRPRLPATVFKYRALHGGAETRAYNLEALRTNYVWAARANSLNDPFDCTSCLDLSRLLLDGLKKSVRAGEITATSPIREQLLEAATVPAFVILAMQQALPSATPAERQQAAAAFTQALAKQENALWQSLREIDQSLLKICSFSTDVTSPLMWAHYGNQQGYCVEYDVAKMNPSQQHVLSPVHYSDERFDISPWFAHSRLGTTPPPA